LLVTPLFREPEGGGFEQTGGTNRTGSVNVEDAGSFILGGGFLVSSNVSVSSRFGELNSFSNLRSFYTQTGGTHEVQMIFSSGRGGLAGLQGGWLKATDISVGPVGELELSGAVVTNTGTFTLVDGAQVRANGNYPYLGKLIVKSGLSILDFGLNAATLHFRDSHDVAWDSPLVVSNWSGSLGGGGTDRFYVGTSSQGLTGDQVARISFVNPAGLPAGTYPAAILATGEIVPSTRPTMGVTRSSSGMVISWSGNSQLLSSTNVTGPYDPVSGATSPYTNSFTEPQRFFILRSP
jgi:hypothetical protein